MEENTVVIPESQEEVETVAPATVFAFAPEEDGNQVDAGFAEPVGEEVQDDETEEVVESEDSEGVDNPVQTQKDISAAIGREKRRIRDKYESDSAYKLGNMMIDDLMKREGITREEAGKKVIENFNAARAKRDNIPVSLLEEIQELKENQSRQTEPDDNFVQEIYNEVLNTPKPKGFDPEVAYNDPAFLELITGQNERGQTVGEPIPAKFAIQIYMANKRAEKAPQEIAERIRANKALPKSIKPQAQVSPTKDWTRVSDEEFLKEKERRKQY